MRTPFASLSLSVLFAVSPAWGRGPSHSQPETPVKAPPKQSRPEEEVLKVIADYRAALEARSIERLASVMHRDVLVLEGVHKNIGWDDYRNTHIGPEMREWKDFKLQNPVIVETIVLGELAYVAQEAEALIVTEKKTVAMRTAETFVLRKEIDGWKIRHVHFSGKVQ